MRPKKKKKKPMEKTNYHCLGQVTGLASMTANNVSNWVFLIFCDKIGTSWSSSLKIHNTNFIMRETSD